MLALQGLHIRAALFRTVREFFAARDFLEVDTPVRQPVIIPECNIVPIAADGQYLQTSPELCMKRLLSAGCTRIFQICPCFRKNELGRKHLEEFTMLEWYRTGTDYRQLMVDCEELLQYVADQVTSSIPHASGGYYEASPLQTLLTTPAEELTVEQAFARYAPISLDRALQEGCFDEMLVEWVEPNLGMGGPLILSEYPKDLAALAKVDPAQPTIAERFELYLLGLELANGFTELTDPDEQRRRFLTEIETIRHRQARECSMPERFLQDLGRLDTAAGIAFGLDRLLMLILGKRSITEVVSFHPDDFL